MTKNDWVNAVDYDVVIATDDENVTMMLLPTMQRIKKIVNLQNS